MSTAAAAASTTSTPASTVETPRKVTRFSAIYAPFIAFAFPMVVYLMTMARGLIWGDGIELAAVADTLGIAHPTGYPLYTMVGHLFTWIPIGSAYWRVTLMCAFSVAGASLILFYLIRSLGDTLWKESFPSPTARAVLALAGALTFSWSLAPWENATLTEVYSVELLFQLGIAALALRVLRTRSVRGFWTMAFLFGLGMTHHMLTLTIAPFLATVAIVLLATRSGSTKDEFIENSAGATSDGLAKSHDVRSKKNDTSESETSPSPAASPKTPKASGIPSPARLLLPAAGFFLIGLLPILYLPIRASQSPPLNWGNPSSLKRLMWTLEGGEFRKYRFMMQKPGTPFTTDTYWTFFFKRAGDLSRYLTGQVIAPDGADNPMWAFMFLAAVVLFLLGIRRFWGRFRGFTVGLLLSLGLYLFFLFTYNIADIRDYELGFLALSWPIFWTGFAEIPRWGAWEWRRVGETRRASRVVLLALAVPLAALLFNYRSENRSKDRLANQYAVRLLKPLPPNAILLTSGDNDIYSCWYLQEVENFRKDVLVYGSNFIFSPWYMSYFNAHELKGRRIGISDQHPTTDVAFIQALGKYVIEPNLGKSLIYTTLDIPPLQRAYVLHRVEDLMTEKELEAAIAQGEFPPGAALYKIVRPIPEKDKAPAPK